MTACCAISADNSDASDVILCEIRQPKRRPFRCNECCDAIPLGVDYEHYVLKYDGRVSTQKTCLLCVEIRNHFSCGGGWIFDHVWEDLRESLFETMTIGGPCMSGLSPAAKQKLVDACLEWRLNHERNGAPPPSQESKVSPSACSHFKSEVKHGRTRYLDGNWEFREVWGREECLDCEAFRGLDGNDNELHDHWLPKEQRQERWNSTTDGATP